MDFSKINKNGSEQLYLQIRRVVFQAIRDGELLPGERIESVASLSEGIGVSSMTVRQALQELIHEGWLCTVPGKGTFVVDQKSLEQDVQKFLGLKEAIKSSGKILGTKVVSINIIKPNPKIVKSLDLKPAEHVYEIIRVRYADQTPLSIDRTYLSVNKFPGLEKSINDSASLYEILAGVYEVQPKLIQQYIDADESDALAEKFLNVPRGKPVLISERVAYTTAEEPVEITVRMTRAGMVRYKTRIHIENSMVSHEIVMNEENFTKNI